MQNGQVENTDGHAEKRTMPRGQSAPSAKRKQQPDNGTISADVSYLVGVFGIVSIFTATQMSIRGGQKQPLIHQRKVLYGFVVFALFFVIVPAVLSWHGEKGLYKMLCFSVVRGRGGMEIFRGANYFGGENLVGSCREEECARQGVVTSWHLFHFMWAYLASYMCPDYALYIWILLAIWELFEWVVVDCADLMDLVWNTAGIALGLTIQKMT